jgi:hypothetical protein
MNTPSKEDLKMIASCIEVLYEPVYNNYGMKVWSLEDWEDGLTGSIIRTTDGGIYHTPAHHDVVIGDFSRITDCLIPELVSITPASLLPLIAFGMIDQGWMDKCMADIKKKAFWLSSAYMRHCESVFGKEMYRQHCRI